MKLSITGILAILFSAWLVPAHAITLSPGTHNLSTTIGGVKRTIVAHVPYNWDGKCGVTLLHGGGGKASGITKTTKMDTVGVAAGCIVTVPDGVGGSWNLEDGRGSTADDMTLLDLIISAIGAEHSYLTGHSRGAMMAYYFACRRDTVSAIAVSAGTVVGDCPDASGIDILHIYGTADSNVPFLGDNSWPSAQAALNAIGKQNDCGQASEHVLYDGDVTTISRICPKGTRMNLVKIDKGGHAWPGARATRRQRRAGEYVCGHYPATQSIINFFLDS